MPFKLTRNEQIYEILNTLGNVTLVSDLHSNGKRSMSLEVSNLNIISTNISSAELVTTNDYDEYMEKLEQSISILHSIREIMTKDNITKHLKPVEKVSVIPDNVSQTES